MSEKRRWILAGGYDGARHAMFVRSGPQLPPNGATVEVVEADGPADGPRFRPGDEVLVDQGPRGVSIVQWVYEGLVPRVRDDLTIGSEPGYVYEVRAVGGERHQAPEYNLEAP